MGPTGGKVAAVLKLLPVVSSTAFSPLVWRTPASRVHGRPCSVHGWLVALLLAAALAVGVTAPHLESRAGHTPVAATHATALRAPLGGGTARPVLSGQEGTVGVRGHGAAIPASGVVLSSTDQLVVPAAMALPSADQDQVQASVAARAWSSRAPPLTPVSA